MTSTTTLARAARLDLLQLDSLARSEVNTLFRTMRGRPHRELMTALRDVIPAIGDDYFMMASSLGADYYDTVRLAAGARGSFSPLLADLPTAGRWDSLVNWSMQGTLEGTRDLENAIKLLNGGLTRTVKDGHRETVKRSAATDGAAQGWARFGNGDTCTFCRMLIGRGAVYSDTSAKFGAHDNCSCVAGPSFDKARRVKGYITPAEPKSDTQKADAARAQAWMAENIK